MSDTRAQLVALSESKILTSGRRTSAANIREVVAALIAAMVNILDDKDQAGGYLGIDEDELVDTSFIQSGGTADKKFLMDDGTFDEVANLVKFVRFTVAAQTMDIRKSHFVYVGATPSAWTSFAISAGGSKHDVINAGAGSLTINYDNGDAKIIDLVTSLTPVNTIVLATKTSKRIINTGEYLIFY